MPFALFAFLAPPVSPVLVYRKFNTRILITDQVNVDVATIITGFDIVSIVQGTWNGDRPGEPAFGESLPVFSPPPRGTRPYNRHWRGRRRLQSQATH